MMKKINLLLVVSLMPVLAFGQLPNIVGRSNNCPGVGTLYTVSGWIPDAFALVWTCTAPGAKINGSTTPVTTNFSDYAEVLVEFDLSGGQLCAEILGGPSNGQRLCKTVTVAPLPPTNLPPIEISDIQLPFLWPADGSTVIQSTGNFQLAATLPSSMGCDSVVRQQVSVLKNAVQGTVFSDVNQNKVFDSGESYVSGTMQIFNGQNLLFLEPVFGEYQIYHMQLGYKMVFIPDDAAAVVFPGSLVYSANTSSGYDFAVATNTSPDLPDWGIDLNNLSPFRPGFKTRVSIDLTHSSTATATRAWVVLPQYLAFISAQPPVTATNGDTLFWDVSPVASGFRKIELVVETNLSAQLGNTTNIPAFVKPVGNETFLANNSTNLRRQIVGSFDPNMKEVSLGTVTPDALAASSTELEYVIHFQNTGNYRADNVSILDRLEAFYDLSSLRVLSASHDFTWQISSDGALRFDFGNINLPDSSSDLRGSMGFVKFSLKPLATLPLGTKITNACDIFFDSNPPISTEEAVTWISWFDTGTVPAANSEGVLYAKPNPASHWLTISWKQPAEQPGLLWLVDLNGVPQRLLHVTAGENSRQLSVSDLSAGNYWAVLQIGAKRMTKLVAVHLGSGSGGIRRD